MIEKTLCIIKPDAVSKNLAGKILARIQEDGLKVIGLRMLHMSRAEAEGFYAVHKERPFFGELVQFMTSGPAVVVALQGEGAIAKWRTIMGATDPAKADEGTLRKLYADNIQNNAVHGSDAPETAAIEIPYWFRSIELVG